VVIHGKEGGVRKFIPLLRAGVRVEVEVGRNAYQVLTSQLGMPSEYVEEKVQTVFLDGRPVDDLTKAVVVDGATLSLSAAMPGLAGAALRKGGFFAPMRFQISLTGGVQTVYRSKGRITLKLFNAVAEDLAPTILANGVWVDGETLDRFLERQPQEFRSSVEGVTVDGTAVEAAVLSDEKWAGKEVFLQFTPGGS
jgi:hypothetical protein